MPLPRLRYGLSGAVPPEAIGAWGCRGIVTQDGHVDLVADRTDRQGDSIILDRLNEQFPPDALVTALADLLRSGQMNTRVRRRFVLHQSATLVVIADTAASAGYCYLAAWTTTSGAESPPVHPQPTSEPGR